MAELGLGGLRTCWGGGVGGWVGVVVGVWVFWGGRGCGCGALEEHGCWGLAISREICGGVGAVGVWLFCA
ncbi:hypothetical protein, partial [Pseudomonas syringae group genomosp. 7]|uniref:hypothetical protein n=1 Tax=Pseudomonas syringae group genomosp. 7 TaxID=251699 RepID=UPI00376FEF1C